MNQDMTGDERERRYIPAFRFKALTPFYDFIMRFTLRENVIKNRLTALVALRPKERALDLGCGTATLTIMLKRSQPEAEVVGLDGDPDVLKIARKKIREADLGIDLDEGTATDLPYPDTSFDVVVTSLMLHHLKTEEKKKALKEIHRTLSGGGRLLVMDLDKPHNPLMYLISLVIGRLEESSDNIKGHIPQFIEGAGFAVENLDRFSTVYGTISIYRAHK